MLSLDMMHLPALNVPDLLIKLWRGQSLTKGHPDDTSNWPWAVFLRQSLHWKLHGADVEALKPYLPTWFERVPRNPAEKINSGYKAWEYLLWMYGAGPALLHYHLPSEYWVHFCKLVRSMHIHEQHEITAEELQEAADLIIDFVNDFEDLYVKRLPERLHFIRPWLHTLLHIALEVIHIGPTCYYSQWTMERTIGFLEEGLRQHSNPYSNLAHVALRHSQVSALKAKIPDLGGLTNQLPRGAIDLGDDYSLRHPREENQQSVTLMEAQAIQDFISSRKGEPSEWNDKVLRWGCAALPNGSIAHTAWKECLRPLEKSRIARMVEVSTSSAL
jgi:hypothetical protein